MTSPAQSADRVAEEHFVPFWTFADRIRKVRRDVLHIEQTEFAEQLGVTRQAYAAWESGRTEPRGIVAIAKRVEAMSRVPADWLLGVERPGGVPTGVDTRRYAQPAGPAGHPLRLVKPGDAPYRPVDPSYGSCPAEPTRDKDRRVGASSGTVNLANSA